MLHLNLSIGGEMVRAYEVVDLRKISSCSRDQK
jgi:hypothetical protein